jgi:transcriptional regulator with XRE-family HTH domain
MDAIRFGAQVRALRIRHGWRQADLASRSGSSRTRISLIERGHVDAATVGQALRVAVALEADLELRLRWRGEGLDRLLDHAHAGLVEGVVKLLHDEDWETAVEVSFSIYGERGSVDVLARHLRTDVLLVVEVKSVVPDSQAMLHGLDRKTRLAPEIARGRGWPAGTVARLLVIADSSTARRRIASLGDTYAAAFPVQGWAVRRWLREPVGGLSGLVFLPYARAGITSWTPTGVQRVRKRGIGSKSAHTPVRSAIERNSSSKPR